MACVREATLLRRQARTAAPLFDATNFMDGRAENGTVHTTLDNLRLVTPAPPGDVTLTIRSEAVRLESSTRTPSPARVLSAAYLGTQVHY